MASVSYKQFSITARTFQVRGSGRWTSDILISHRRSTRAYSSAESFATEGEAIEGCFNLGRRIIDGRVAHCPVEELPLG